MSRSAISIAFRLAVLELIRQYADIYAYTIVCPMWAAELYLTLSLRIAQVPGPISFL